MVFARPSTSSDATRAEASATAFLRASRSFHTALDQTKGRCRSDAFSFGRRIHPRQVNPAVPSLSRHTTAGSGKLTGCAITAAPVHFIPARSVGANRPFARRLASKLPLQSVAHLATEHFRVLSSSARLVGFDANGKELTRGSQPLSPDDKTYD